MDTREIAAEYRLAHWTGIMRRRTESGQSIKAFCETEGIHENTYFYWQKKLREAACQGLLADNQSNTKKTAVPAGWAICAATEAESSEEAVNIEIGKYRIKANARTNIETLIKVCRGLATIC